jgi:NTE family protein
MNLNLFKENTTKSYLKFGLHYDGLFKSAVLVNLTRKKTLFKNDVASLDVVLGITSGIILAIILKMATI